MFRSRSRVHTARRSLPCLTSPGTSDRVSISSRTSPCITYNSSSVHNNESTECPDCGKALTISNLNKHIKSVHKKLKKTCDICNEEVPYSSIRLVTVTV